MPVLKNAKHERFAQELAKGKTADEAYQLAGYAENRGNATRLKANESVAARVLELAERGAELTVVTVESLITEAHDIQTKALAAGQYAAATGALTAKAKLAGKWVERAEVEQKVEVTDARERLARIVAGHAPARDADQGAGKPH